MSGICQSVVIEKEARLPNLVNWPRHLTGHDALDVGVAIFAESAFCVVQRVFRVLTIAPVRESGICPFLNRFVEQSDDDVQSLSRVRRKHVDPFRHRFTLPPSSPICLKFAERRVRSAYRRGARWTTLSVRATRHWRARCRRTRYASRWLRHARNGTAAANFRTGSVYCGALSYCRS